MALNKNTFFSNSFSIFTLRFFPSLANLVVMIYYSKRLPADVYGNYNNFWIQLSVIYPIICFGLHALIMTYSGDTVVHLIRNIKRKQYVLYGAWAVMLGSAFAYMQWHKLGVPFWVSFLFILSFAVTFIFESLLMVFKNFRLLIAVNIGYSLAFWLAHYFVLKDAFSVNKIFSLLLIITFLRAAIYIIYVSYKLKRQGTATTEITIPGTQQIRSLWLHLGLYDMVQNLSVWIDKFIISLMLTSGLSAVYYNGSMNIPFLPLLISAAGSAFLIQLASGSQQDEKSNAIALLNQTGKILSCIVFPVFFFSVFFSHELFVGILFSEKYAAALPIFIASQLVLPVRAYNFTSVLQRLHQGATINKGAVGEVVIAILIAYPLYLWLGLPGFALSFVISTYMQATYYIIATAKVLQVSAWKLIPAANWAAKFVIIGVAFFVMHYLTTAFCSSRAAFFMGAGVMVLVVLAGIFFEVRKGKGSAA